MRKMRLFLSVVACSLLFLGCMPADKPDKKAVSDTEQSSIAAVSVESSKDISDESNEAVSDIVADASGDTPVQQSGQSSESSLSDEDKKIFNDMHKTDERIRELIDSEEFEGADEEHRKELANKLLSELADEGYIIRDSILESDDSISFTYRGGILGGIHIRDFDPYMN